ncbi:MAG TPA: DNA-3-methyladenine glycosylase [Solirubrobacteraceae bacterium]
MAGAVVIDEAFFARGVVQVARDLVGCVVRHGGVAGRIVETEAYHSDEPASHSYAGRTARTAILFGPPGIAYVYRSYGIHALLNAVCEDEAAGAAVLIRALEPLEGLESMRARRGLQDGAALCSGPGKLTQALGVVLEHNGTSLLRGPVRIEPPPAALAAPRLVAGPRIGITKATDLPWRFSQAGSRYVSKPWPAGGRGA